MLENKKWVELLAIIGIKYYEANGQFSAVYALFLDSRYHCTEHGVTQATKCSVAAFPYAIPKFSIDGVFANATSELPDIST